MAKRKKPQQAKQPAKNHVQPESMSLARKISWFSLLAMIFITPLAVANLSWLGIQIPISFDQFDILKVFCQRVLGLLALGAWSWDILIKGGKVRRTPVEWLILAFLAWVTLSTIFSIHPATAFFGKYRRFEGLLSFINYAVIYFLIMQFADRPSRIRRIAQVLFWSGFLVALYGVMQSLGIEIMNWNNLPFEQRRAFSTYGNPDLLGGFLMFSTFISIGLALAEKNLTWRAIYWIGFLLNGVCVIVAFTRSAWVGGLVGFAFLVLLAVYQKTPWKSEDWAFSGSTAVLVLAAVMQSLKNPNEVMNFGKRFQSIFVFNAGSAETRFQIWQAAISATKHRPIFGFGPDTFRLVFPTYKPREYVADAGYLSVADNVHNYVLQLTAGIGIPGMIMLYSIFGWVAIRSWKSVFNREGGPDRMILAAFWVACAAYITHLFFGLSVTGSTFLLWVSMAVLLAPTAGTVTVKAPSWGGFAALGFAILCIAGISYQFVLIGADRAYLFARVATQGHDRTLQAQKAVRLNPFNDIYRAEVGLAYTDEAIAVVNQVMSAQDDSGRMQAQITMQSLFVNAEASLKDTIAFVPQEYDNYVFLANLYTVAGQFIDAKYYEDAIATARKGIAVEKYGPAIRYQLARPLAQTGQFEEAIRQTKIAVDMDPRYVEAAQLLASLYEQTGKLDEALKVLRSAQLANPAETGLAESITRIEASSTATATPGK